LATEPHNLTEDRAREIAMQAVDAAGGPRAVYRNPRHPFALHPSTDYEFDGYQVELRHGEISSPAIVSVAGWVFEIHEEDIELLMKPRRKGGMGR
jgi:hypothetical protein